MFEGLTEDTIAFAALLALIITYVVTKAVDFISFYTKPANMKFNYKRENVKAILDRCCSLFPKEDVTFKGDLFKRGMVVRVTTNQHFIFEGKIVGMNKNNILCIITPKYVVAQELSHITGIEKIEEDGS